MGIIETKGPPDDDPMPLELLEATKLSEKDFSEERCRRILSDIYLPRHVNTLGTEQLMPVAGALPQEAWHRGKDIMDLEPYLSSMFRQIKGEPTPQIAESLSMSPKEFREWRREISVEVRRVLDFNELTGAAGIVVFAPDQPQTHETPAAGLRLKRISTEAGNHALNGASITPEKAVSSDELEDLDDNEYAGQDTEDLIPDEVGTADVAAPTTPRKKNGFGLPRTALPLPPPVDIYTEERGGQTFTVKVLPGYTGKIVPLPPRTIRKGSRNFDIVDNEVRPLRKSQDY